MGTQQHIIQKIHMDLKCSGERSSQDLPFQYQEALQNEVLPALEEVLDTYSDSDELIRIDQLNIDLGNLKLGLTGKSLSQKMLLAIEQAIKEQVGPKQKKKAIQRLPMEAVQIDLLVQFLAKGYWTGATQDLNLAKTILHILQKSPKPFFQAIKTAFAQYGPKVLKRLVLQLPEDKLELIFEKAIAWSAVKAITPVKTIFFEHIPKSGMQKRQLLWQELLHSIFSMKEEKAQVGIQLTPSLIQLIQLAPKLKKSLEGLAERHPELKILQEIKEIANKDQKTLVHTEQLITEKNSTLESKEKKEIQEDLEKGLMVENAGIILLHPFLKSFFSESDLFDETGAFKNTSAAERGVGLLHFLATGEKEAGEHQLVFQKLLCNLPLNHTMPRHFIISEKEIAESQKMMNAAIQYWDALGNSSVAGLQQGFLQRGGSVQQNENNLSLKIEYKTMDILLDKIPWNISMIQLPWLKGLLTVNWRK